MGRTGGDARGHIPRSDEPRRDRTSASDVADGDADGSSSRWPRWLALAAAAAVAALLVAGVVGGDDLESLSYSAFLDRVEAGEVARVTIDADGVVTGAFRSGRGDTGTGAGDAGEGDGGDGADAEFRTVIPTATSTDRLVGTLRDADVDIDAEPPGGGFLSVLLVNALPLLLLVGLVWLVVRRRSGGGGLSALTGIGRTRAKVVDDERPDVRFDDVAGYEGVKREVGELIDYLRDPDRFRAVGARGPGGVLLAGPPGTGKTLLARAVAGEAKVPFISAAGSEFVEMLVGVGASRVRDLFAKARASAPSIVFIDELDSLGRRRGSANTIGANNEQEQTLNQLLAEMDGFDPTEGVVVLAATNRPEMLDPALTRPGRFDRTISVGAPTQRDRRAILEIHTRAKPLADDVDLEIVARGTPGFTGADLENLTNEAAIVAVREGRDRITMADFDTARDRLLIGRRAQEGLLSDEERRRVAVHEAGHAIVAASRDHADPVEKVSILPTGQALGVTQQLPHDDRRLYPESYLRDLLDVRMGGRCAELLVLGEASSGAAADLAQATDVATRMVRDFGLSDELGPVGYADPSRDDDGPAAMLRGRPFAEETQRALDREVARRLRDAEERATKTLHDRHGALERLVAELLEEETVTGPRVYELVGRRPPRREGDGPAAPVDGHGAATPSTGVDRDGRPEGGA